MEHAMNLLTDCLIRFIGRDGTVGRASLPGVFGLLGRDEVASFPALRPHQRHAWHAFLVQLGSLALLRAELTEMPESEEAWRDLLRALAPEHETAWYLVADFDCPALLQAPLPGGVASDLRTRIDCADALDMLVTSRNHDVKAAVMAVSQPDDWVFALVTLQTMEGFLGAGNYGVSRMNGGFSNRPALSIVPAGGPGRAVQRDIRHLLALRGAPARSNPAAGPDALALVWLAPWDGATSLAWSSLHPLYIEICRRVRLVCQDGQITALAGGSRAARIAGVPDGGVTGDPWTPIRPDKGGGMKALTVDSTGFSYRPLLRLLFPVDGEPAPLQQPSPADDPAGLTVLARALVRGQGKTEGLYERRVRISRKQRTGLTTGSTDLAGAAAREREQLAGEMAGALRFALMALFQNGRAEVNVRHEPTARRAKPFLDQYERLIDQTFFDDLFEEAEAEAGEPRAAVRTAWVKGLLAHARRVLEDADQAAARATNLSFRARVRAQDALRRSATRKPLLAPHLTEPTHAP